MIDYKQTILRCCFKNFFFDEATRRIKPQLYQGNLERLIETGRKECGYTRKLAIDLIQTTIDGLSNGTLNPLRVSNEAYCCLNDLPTFTIVKIHYNGPSLTLLYINSYWFCVLADEGHTLLPGDILQCFTYTFSVGEEAFFRVVRNGRQYPNEHQIMRLQNLNAIEIIELPDMQLAYSNTHPVVAKGEAKALVCQATQYGENFLFLPQHFTTDRRQALFEVDLSRMTFVLNRDFDQHLFSDDGDGYVGYIKEVCNYSIEEDVERRRITIEEGQFEYIPVNNCQYALKVTSKARITL